MWYRPADGSRRTQGWTSDNPIGQYEPPETITAAEVARWIDEIEALPGEMRRAVEGLTDEQLDTPYRAGGWTLRQVVHHVPDSHLNSYVRFKWALTEEEPIIKTYEEARWAELADYRLPVDTSLDFLELLHAKWVALLRSLTPEQLSRRFVHPEWGAVELSWNVGNYAWHGRHHLAHITTTVAREGWSPRAGVTSGARRRIPRRPVFCIEMVGSDQRGESDPLVGDLGRTFIAPSLRGKRHALAEDPRELP